MRARVSASSIGWMAKAIIIVAWSAPVVAAEGPRMRNLGEGLEIGAALGAAQVMNDNFYYQYNNETEVEGLLLSPSLSVKQTFGRGSASLNVGAQIGEFDLADDANDYTDTQIVGRFNYDGGVRSALDLEAGSYRGHDPFGVDRTAGAAQPLPDLDEWIQNKGNASYRYGAPSAKLNLELEAGFADKEYTTNEIETEPLNYSKWMLSQMLVFNYSPKTSFLLDLNEDFVNFDIEPPAGGRRDRDAQELRLRAGARWKATGKTTGDVRVGVTRRELDDSRVRVLDGTSWKAKIVWEPLARTAFALESFRSSQEAVSNAVDVLDNRRYSLNYSQGWGRHFRTVLGAGVGTSQFIGTDRKDDLSTFAFSAIYSFKGSLTFYADIVRTERDSNQSGPLQVDETALDFTSVGAIVGIRISP